VRNVLIELLRSLDRLFLKAYIYSLEQTPIYMYSLLIIRPLLYGRDRTAVAVRAVVVRQPCRLLSIILNNPFCCTVAHRENPTLFKLQTTHEISRWCWREYWRGQGSRDAVEERADCQSCDRTIRNRDCALRNWGVAVIDLHKAGSSERLMGIMMLNGCDSQSCRNVAAASALLRCAIKNIYFIFRVIRHLHF
jgi:hypothetical protein